jgi:hypothetical protein
MSNQRENRVLSRLGARELNELEMESVSGAIVGRRVCTFISVTCTLDGPFPCIPPPPACGN